MLVAVSHVSSQYVIVGKARIFPPFFLPEPGKDFPTEETRPLMQKRRAAPPKLGRIMEEMTVTQVAELLGKTDRTIRNYIKDGRIMARRVENQFGWEYRVYDLGNFATPKTESGTPEKTENPSASNIASKAETALQVTSQENTRLWEENRQLREVNNRLAYDLGARDQRIKDLENELEKVSNLLPVGGPPAVLAVAENGQNSIEVNQTRSKPWWKRLFRQ
jgi:excisionase family DNA binding protein